MILGTQPGHLTVRLVRDTQFIDSIELHDPMTGLPMDWPAGTTAWLRLWKSGTPFDVSWPATVVGAVLSWNTLPALVNDVPTGSKVQLWLDYTDPGLLPFVWLQGPVDTGRCSTAGFGTYAVIPPGYPNSGAVAVPVPGPPGPGGGESGSWSFNETPSGVKNGVNLNFTLTAVPLLGTLMVYRNGLREQLGIGFTVAGSTVTFTTAPLTTDELTVDYQIA